MHPSSSSFRAANGHNQAGNCAYGRNPGDDACYEHGAERGQCDVCPVCPACDIAREVGDL